MCELLKNASESDWFHESPSDDGDPIITHNNSWMALSSYVERWGISPTLLSASKWHLVSK